MSRLIEFLSELKQDRRNEIEGLKAGGRVIAGYFCNFVPVEIIESCGCIPVRIKDEVNLINETTGRKYIQRDSCSFCKAAIGSLADNTDYTCIVYGTTCDQLRRLHEFIAEKTGIKTLLFHAPRTFGKESTAELFLKEMEWIINELTGLSGADFNNDLLLDRVRKWNELRTFLNRIHNLRQETNPGITGKEMFHLVSTAYYLGPERFLENTGMIESIIADNKKTGKDFLRIFFAGSITAAEDDYILDIIEDNRQGLIISDNTCTGVRWFSSCINDRGNILENISDHYYSDTACPNRKPNNLIYDFTDRQIEDHKPDGIIYRSLKFCHPWTFEALNFKQRYNMPFLHIDTDYSRSNIGQLRTRIQAFYEMIKAKKSEYSISK
ncbi:MAG: 2-hydroxyacyl-CoA dehydratase [bacterium]|nr:2-hydroxyacyl-CoA dehydratase [bacterium]